MIPIETIEKAVCEFEHVEQKDLHIKTRQMRFVRARQIIIYFASLQKYGIEYAAGYFGLHHATAIYSRRLIENRIKYEPEFAGYIERINESMKYYLLEGEAYTIEQSIETLKKRVKRLHEQLESIN